MAFGMNGAAAYKQTIRETEDPRAIERRVFAKVTAELEKVAETENAGSENSPKPASKPEAMKALNDALGDNAKLWSAMFAAVTDSANELPAPLRAQIVNIALFIDSHTPKVIAGEGSVRALIDINRSIMKGLEGVAPSAADAAKPTPGPVPEPAQAGGSHGA